MFLLTKLLWILLAPDMLFLLALLAGAALLWTRRARLGRLLLSLLAVVAAAVWVLPLGDWILRPLEDRFPQPELPANLYGVIVLGGAQDPRLTEERGQPSINSGAERVFAMLELARRFPDAALLFTGGTGSLQYPQYSEAETMKQLLTSIGFDTSRVTFESASRTTEENARLSRELVGNATARPWALVTSAAHMPRAVGVFRAQGWNVIPHPVDYATGGEPGLDVQGGFGAKLAGFAGSTREWLGLAYYRLVGMTQILFPGPGVAAGAGSDVPE